MKEPVKSPDPDSGHSCQNGDSLMLVCLETPAVFFKTEIAPLQVSIWLFTFLTFSIDADASGLGDRATDGNHLVRSSKPLQREFPALCSSTVQSRTSFTVICTQTRNVILS